MPLLFLPDRCAFFLWGDGSAVRTLPFLASDARFDDAEVVVPTGRQRVAGLCLPLLDTVIRLSIVPDAEVASLSASVTSWCLASKLALDLATRERVVPTLVRDANGIQARWVVALSAPEDAARVAAIASSMPPSAHAVPVPSGAAGEVWAPDALLRVFLDATADALVRPDRTRLHDRRHADDGERSQWEQRWLAALETPAGRFEPRGFAERTLVDDLVRWSEPALGGRDRLRACFRLELPARDAAPFVLRFLLQSPEDPSLLVSAAEVWKTSARGLQRFGRAFRDPQEALLAALGQAARLFPPIEASLAEPRPEALTLDPANAWAFLGEGAAALAQAGLGVIVPGELTTAGQRRLRLRMRVGSKSKTAGAVSGAAGLGLDALVAFEWEAALGDEPLSARELVALAKQKAPLVRYRGAWVAVDPRELAEIQKRVARGAGKLTMREALGAALAGEIRAGGMAVSVTAEGGFARVLERLRKGGEGSTATPATLRATLRPYQERGLAWLSTMSTLGLGACLADDMGLGKTVQILAFLLWRLESAPEDARPALLVAPTSVVGNWEREIERFSPDLVVARHYGSERAREAAMLPQRPGTLVVTTYGLLRRDAELLAQVEWSAVVLDEAQNIKNAMSATARAACSLRAAHRFALTGTPVENRLAELWSILEFANPGLLGSLETFRREYAVPIERFGKDDAAERLRRIVSPFLLRRVKSDPSIIQDLPPKNEMKVICTLTREQASLYKAVVDEEMERIESAEGIERRGRVLALLMFLKQICNHPAQYLGEAGPLKGRAGKLARLTEMLGEALMAGDKALVFTQFREMGERLVAHLGESLDTDVAFLHGGTPKKKRDELVRQFQEETRGPRVFVLSVKAGGTGLNLTAASHVFHYDRWWNPAVEDQATDRAYRIGQTRAVQVHKLLCAGTVEEKVDRLLEHKRKLASKIIGAGEQWITELGDTELRELVALSKEAVIGEDDHADAETTPKRRRARSRSQEARP
jgi:superfamily II DNA or RNA helicase